MIYASAPGSVMVSGEHAVVFGHPAIVCAVEQRLSVRLEALAGEEVQIISEIAPPLHTSLTTFTPTGPLRFVLSAIAMYRPRLQGGLRVSITSQINPTLGLGSSAAATIATLGALRAHTNCTGSAAALHLQALTIIREQQGRGSGADLAASLWGGAIGYQLPEELLSGVPQPENITTPPATVTPLPAPEDLSLRYCGYKTPTAEVLARVAHNMQGREAQFHELYARMGANTRACIEAVAQKGWRAAGRLLTAYQRHMDTLGVSDDTLNRMISQARAQEGVYASKISGSGLGDCILALGTPRPQHHWPAPVAKHGLLINNQTPFPHRENTPL